MSTPSYKVMDLIPPISKHTFAREIDPSDLIDGAAKFEALAGLDWLAQNFQTEEDKEMAKDDPELQKQKGQGE